MGNRQNLTKAHRIVVKVGTSTLTYANGQMNLNRIDKLVREITDVVNQGREVILVSSGAIATGMVRLGLKQKPADIPQRQALAAVGQGMLFHIYEKFFAEYGKIPGQLLLTRENSLRHNQYSHSRNALMAMLRMGVIPIINENDAVAVEEIKIGDNDSLSAVAAMLCDADLLIILSDIDGLYTANPQTDPTATLIEEIDDITPQVEAMAGGAGSSLGTGGMQTKIAAAKMAVNSGVNMVIAQGSKDGNIRRILAGENVGTLFAAKSAHLRVRKSWLAFGKAIAGELVVDAGCEKAMLEKNTSLLAAGITMVEGEFAAGSTVRVLNQEQREIARGIINYGSAQVAKLMGHKTSDFASLIDGKIYEEVIHRDNMVIMA